MDVRLDPQFNAAVAAKLLPGVGGIIMSKSGEIAWKGTFGTTNIANDSAPAFTEHTPSSIFSMTKLVTTVAALQLIESGKLSIDDPVEKYAPQFAEIEVLENFAEDGSPRLRAPAGKPTVRHLLTHTVGLTYDFFDATTLKWRLAVGQPPSPYGQGKISYYQTPFVHEPGTRYIYGIATDWLGLVVQGVTGTSLPEYVAEHILRPLKMTNSFFKPPPATVTLSLHLRIGGDLHPAPDLLEGVEPEFYGGGSSLFSSLHDYSQFLLALLNDGEHPTLKVRILSADTVQSGIFADQLAQMEPRPDSSAVGVITSAVPQMSLEGELLPGVDKTWSLGLMVNKQDCPKGRRAGSGSWAGLANTYYLLDRTAGKLLVFITSVLPFVDPQALHLWDEMERAAYGHEGKTHLGAEGGNHVCWPSQPAS